MFVLGKVRTLIAYQNKLNLSPFTGLYKRCIRMLWISVFSCLSDSTLFLKIVYKSVSKGSSASTSRLTGSQVNIRTGLILLPVILASNITGGVEESFVNN